MYKKSFKEMSQKIFFMRKVFVGVRKVKHKVERLGLDLFDRADTLLELPTNRKSFYLKTLVLCLQVKQVSLAR